MTPARTIALPIRLLRNRWFLWLAPSVCLLALFVPGVWEGDFRTDSHAYAAVTCALLDGHWEGGWLGPRMGHAPYFNKPPLTFWLAAPFVAIAGGAGNPLGVLIAVRAASAVALVGAAIASFGLWRTLTDRKTAYVATIILVLTHEVFRYSHAFSLDTWLLCFVTTGLWFLAMSAQRGGRSAWHFAIASGVAVGLGLMVKPVVALLAIVIGALWMATARDRAHGLLRCAIALGVALIVAAPWHVWISLNIDRFADQYFVRESLDRATGEGFGTAPWWTYFSELAKTYWPWLAALVGGAIAAPIVRPRVNERTRTTLSLAIAWTGVWLLVLTLFADKRARYLVPMYPAASLLVCFSLRRLFRRQIRRATLIGAARAPVAVVGVSIILTALSAAGVVQIHRPLAAWKPEIVQVLRDEQLLDRAWIFPQHERDGANVYLYGGIAPRVVGINGEPEPGDALLDFSREELPAEHRAWLDRGENLGTIGRCRVYVIEEP
ncbi:MAG: glycosyltransferase family 39 protein [Planctomycetota bacterium]